MTHKLLPNYPFLRFLICLRISVIGCVSPDILFDGHALRQIPGLIDVRSPFGCDIISEELERHDRQEGHQQRMGRRDRDDRIRAAVNLRVAPRTTQKEFPFSKAWGKVAPGPESLLLTALIV